MQHFSRTLLAASISTALLATQALANTSKPVSDSASLPPTDQCMMQEGAADNQAPIVIQADHLQAIGNDKAMYSGDVEVTQGAKRITAESITYHQNEQVAIAEGDVSFTDGQVMAHSARVTSNLENDTFELEDTRFHFLCDQGRGNAAYVAKIISRTGQPIYELEDGSLTSCPPGDNAWQMVAENIEIDQTEETATFYHSRFEVLDVPIFYMPYLTLPVGDTRKTGFLFPSISYGSNDGFELEVPFYWNIAPNYDLTFTTLYMSQRGVKFDNDFRYLTDGYGMGELKVEYMQHDKKYQRDDSRWGYQIKHDGIIDKQWLVNLDYSQVSDIDYFLDLPSDIGNREDGQLLQQGRVAYRSQFWDMSLMVRDFQILLTEDNQPYRLLPQLAFNYYSPLWDNTLRFDVRSQASHFDTNDADKPNAMRLHVEPGLILPLSNTWAEWTTEARAMATYYRQDLKDNAMLEHLYDETVNRFVPEFRSHLRLHLERPTTIFEGYTQTLEPQMQYLYVPDENQSRIFNYDTTLLQTDYYGLFRSRKYSSIDKIAPANQLSYGASTRFFDENYRERLNISFGQIYFIDTKTKLNQINDDASNYSSWAVEADFNYNDMIYYHGGVQYDIDLKAMQLANSTLEYRFDKGFVQGNYRYVTRDYIAATVSPVGGDWSRVTSDGISQAGIVAAYDMNPNWSFAGQYYYDLVEHIDLEWLASLRYQSDCWYIGLTYANQIVGWNDEVVGINHGNLDYESNVSVNFGIQGFATNSKAYTAAKELDSSDNAITYGRPFYLND
ncbi:LPS assembly protein LptD [Vibrio sp. SM6]|uniref:LPS-assembly protein LptD n=1 Tax=Vibrio agarilyticus TaxID=2726741 RepID=A0A7X8TPR5_9VIBR|nr:LPS assembly protein LptD [Vibrio agarilyticus]NLS12376.1 LPS assembly protein LptD [Vibrio agarilyticus]